ncbi:hypothetical protein COHA_007930 [Chlorella ohadii]|uniref:LysM domain-containing protein n=1 Tax=Chlorella ohadii TaxID=2649997 RepID=A0AAD5DLA4_9CHLO|nr:hypothetical protein COHA_007930 [Chlorella ohadii]
MAPSLRSGLLLLGLLVVIAPAVQGRRLLTGCKHKVSGHGQSLRDVAEDYHVDYHDLLQRNEHIHDPHWLHPGTSVNLPSRACRDDDKWDNKWDDDKWDHKWGHKDDDHKKEQKKHEPEPKHKPEPPHPAPAPSGHCTYEVVEGDYLYKIAEEYHIKLDELLKLNTHIDDPHLIYPGDKINVPC